MGWSYKNEWPKAFDEMNRYLKDGRLKVQETNYEGLKNMPKAFIGLFKGENTGKAIIKAQTFTDFENNTS